MRVVTLYHGFLSADPSTSYKPNHSVILITYASALSRIHAIKVSLRSRSSKSPSLPKQSVSMRSEIIKSYRQSLYKNQRRSIDPSPESDILPTKPRIKTQCIFYVIFNCFTVWEEHLFFVSTLYLQLNNLALQRKMDYKQ